jgi:hypothetical protein
MVYLWRAVDAEVLDVLVQSKRNKHQIDVVKMPGRMRFRTALAQMRGDHRPEVVHPAAQRSIPSREWKSEEIKETATRAAQEYSRRRGVRSRIASDA